MGEHLEVQSQKMGQTGIKTKIIEWKHMFISDYDGSRNLFLTFAISDNQCGLPKVTFFCHPQMKTYSCRFIFAPRNHCYVLSGFLENVLIDYLNKNHMTQQGSELIIIVTS